MQQELKQYIQELNRLYKAGNATEHSYRPALQSLLEKMVETDNYPSLQVTNEPKRIECGAPDYIVTRGEIPVGYIEAKDIGTDLNSKTYKEQFDRYKNSLDNLIITDYLTFQSYFYGVKRAEVTIAEVSGNNIILKAESTKARKRESVETIIDKTSRVEPLEPAITVFTDLIQTFAHFKGETILTSENLSKIMALKARLMANIIENVLNNDENTDKNSLENQLKGFKKVLIPTISNKEFSDMYAQTIAYGMFAAKINEVPNSTPLEGTGVVFTRSIAAQHIPHSNPFLRNFFQYIAGFDLDKRICWVVDELADIFNHIDIYAIKQEFSGLEHDPIIHFYETFLSQYDPALRKSRGVWYTPQPVVKFIVQAVDDILKSDFGLSQGLADESKVKMKQHVKQKDDTIEQKEKEYHRVQILDPAAGTGTFLAEVVNNIYSHFASKGAWQSYVSDHLIPRLNGFEILMASYSMAHLKLDMLLQQTGYQHSLSNEEERLRVFLTNSLEESQDKMEIPFVEWLTEEANEASNIKNDVPLMVILGNPPYSGESQNSGKWMDMLMNDFKKEPSGIRLQEKNSKWINDDYVKFIRYGQYFIEKNGYGVLAYINNHSFLDNPTFRGMRYRLLKTFDTIYILDLHGNTKKKETTPDGGKDENVFDIQQGVSINIFVKRESKTRERAKAKNVETIIDNSSRLDSFAPSALATVYHYDLYGKRNVKYKFLLNNTLQTVKWEKLKLAEPQYFFTSKDFSLKKEYDKGFSLQELFNKNSVGIVTAKDAVFVNPDKKTLTKNIKDYLKISPDEKLIQVINYRPFDNRYIYYDTKKIERARENVMQHFLIGENIGFISIRRNRNPQTWNFVFLTDNMVSGATAISSLDINYVFPLYLYTPNGVADNDPSPYHKHHNLNNDIIAQISKSTSLKFVETDNYPSLQSNTFSPIDILDYIYAILHGPKYRECYKEFLKIDFPRVPFPKNADEFWQYVSFGSKLRSLHLMENIEPEKEIAIFPVTGSNEIVKIQYNCGKVFINDTQYFENVSEIAWNFYIGGYQPAQKWLKDRKGKILNFDDINHYRKIITVLIQTDKLMQEIDDIYKI